MREIKNSKKYYFSKENRIMAIIECEEKVKKLKNFRKLLLK